MTNQVQSTSPSTLVSTISPRAFGLLPARDFVFGSTLRLPALVLFRDPMLPFVGNPFLPAAVKISTWTRFFLVGDSGLWGEGGLASILPGVKDADRGLLCRGVDLGLGVVGAIDLGLDLGLVGDGGVVVNFRPGDLWGEGWTGVGRGRSTSILSSSAFRSFVVLALRLFAGRDLVGSSSSSSSGSALAFTLPFVDVTDIEILREWDDAVLARSSSSLLSSSIVRLLRLRDARDVELW
jgi:hypothetical protein